MTGAIWEEWQAGLDFALILLREWCRITLSGNGVRAISDEHWINQDMATCCFFARSNKLVRDSGRPV